MSGYHHHGVDWSPRLGARCPLCGAYTKSSENRGAWMVEYGCKTRTHICPNPECIDPATGQRTRMKSTEKDEAARGVVPSPEDLRFLRAYRTRDGGEKRGGVKIPAGWLGLPGVEAVQI